MAVVGRPPACGGMGSNIDSSAALMPFASPPPLKVSVKEKTPTGGHAGPDQLASDQRLVAGSRFSITDEFASVSGSVYFLTYPRKLNFTEAVQACGAHASHMAKVGQIYAAWKLAGLDRCDAGWLADGSVRYPIARPRANCGPPEPGVRSFGFPPKHLKFGVYCYQ